MATSKLKDGILSLTLNNDDLIALMASQPVLISPKVAHKILSAHSLVGKYTQEGAYFDGATEVTEIDSVSLTTEANAQAGDSGDYGSFTLTPGKVSGLGPTDISAPDGDSALYVGERLVLRRSSNMAFTATGGHPDNRFVGQIALALLDVGD